MKRALLVLVVCLLTVPSIAQVVKVSSTFKIARLKYAGGGDWYNDQSAEVNLLKFRTGV
jgi:hypothetical protein